MTADEELLLDELLEVESGLSTWEMDFLDDMNAMRGRELTDKQAAKLHEIARRLGLEA